MTPTYETRVQFPVRGPYIYAGYTLDFEEQHACLHVSSEPVRVSQDVSDATTFSAIGDVTVDCW